MHPTCWKVTLLISKLLIRERHVLPLFSYSAGISFFLNGSLSPKLFTIERFFTNHRSLFGESTVLKVQTLWEGHKIWKTLPPVLTKQLFLLSSVKKSGRLIQIFVALSEKLNFIINIILLIGGKGRTGTMICVWLVEAGVFSTATQSLDYFGNRRTDTNVSKKFQGVSDFILLPKLFWHAVIIFFIKHIDCCPKFATRLSIRIDIP